MPNVTAESSNPKLPAVNAKHTAKGVGVSASSATGIAVRAQATSDTAVFATTTSGVAAVDARNVSGSAVLASSEKGIGLEATTKSNTAVSATSVKGIAVEANAKVDTAIFATTESGVAALDARNVKGAGILASSKSGTGIVASSEKGIAIEANAKADTAIFATTESGVAALDARNVKGAGILASSKSGTGIVASSEKGIAIEANAKADTAIFATTENGFAAIDARNTNGQFAGFFQGVVRVTGDIQLENADCAEEFSAEHASDIEPGTVMVIDSEYRVRESTGEYDRRVAGVVSGAGDLKPGLVLGKVDGAPARVAIGLVGRVYCKVDADYGCIEVGDLLTTSPTPGHAMKAADQSRAFGAVLGKALRGAAKGQMLIPILVALQ
jgi:hypothetical protein